VVVAAVVGCLQDKDAAVHETAAVTISSRGETAGKVSREEPAAPACGCVIC
jgi:hypothetical protein